MRSSLQALPGTRGLCSSVKPICPFNVSLLDVFPVHNAAFVVIIQTLQAVILLKPGTMDLQVGRHVPVSTSGISRTPFFSCNGHCVVPDNKLYQLRHLHTMISRQANQRHVQNLITNFTLQRHNKCDSLKRVLLTRRFTSRFPVSKKLSLEEFSKLAPGNSLPLKLYF